MSKRITSLTELTIPKDDMELMAYDKDDTFDKKISYANLMKPLSGAIAPAVTPDFIGQRYIDTTGKREYFAVGTSSSADWRKVARYEYATVTITAGGGDVTVNLDFDWTDGKLEVIVTRTSTEYYEDADDIQFKYETTEDALTGAYATDQVVSFMHRAVAAGGNQDNFIVDDAGTNRAGMPSSATATSVVLDDDGANTTHAKLIIIA